MGCDDFISCVFFNEAKKIFSPNELFASISARYGKQLCQMVYLNSAAPGEQNDKALLPDSWKPIIQSDNRGLQSGLDLAKQNLYSNKIGSHPSEVYTLFFNWKKYIKISLNGT